MTLTPNSYFINYRNGVASGFGIDPINDFVRAVRNRSPYPVTAEDGLAVSRICEAVHRSLKSGKPEKFELLARIVLCASFVRFY